MFHRLTTVRSPLDADDAFHRVCDLRNARHWCPDVERSIQLVGRGPEGGAQYEIVAGGRDLWFTVIACEEPHSLLALSTTPRATSS